MVSQMRARVRDAPDLLIRILVEGGRPSGTPSAGG